MGSLDERGVGAPSGGFERSSVEEVVIQGDQTLADAISNLAEVADAQLVRYQTGTQVSARTFWRMGRDNFTLPPE